MSWVLLGSNRKRQPFKFESSSIKGSIRVALNSYKNLCKSSEESELPEHLERYGSDLSEAGLYLILKDQKIAGFWIVFGH